MSVSESSDSAGFHRLLSDTLARHEVAPVHSVTELDLLMSRLPDEIRLFAAHRENSEPIAAALVFDFGEVVHTQYLASTECGREIGALDLIIHQLATEVYVDRRYLSFGISTEEDGRILNEGLISYKDSFGGIGQVIDTYEIEL